MFYDDKASSEVSQASDVTFKTSIYQRNNNTSKSNKLLSKIKFQSIESSQFHRTRST